MRFLLVLLLIVVAGCSSSVAELSSEPPPANLPEFEIEFIEHDDGAIDVVATGPIEWVNSLTPENAASILTFRLASSKYAMAGKYVVKDDFLIFTPDFSPVAGEQYVAKLELPRFERTIEKEYTAPRVEVSNAPEVLGIYPTVDQLPANHLKFYLLFSEPMETGDIFKHFRLMDRTTDEQVPRPFRHTELWSSDGRRLTLWFHPGRQKTGVNLNEEIGPVLKEGHQYDLIISEDWQSETGVPFPREYVKSFEVVDADHAQPDHRQWKILTPLAETHNPLAVEFGESLDWALIRSEIRVVTKKGQVVEGNVSTLKDEKACSFIPAMPWPAGEFRLRIGIVLEDLAGNSIEKPFEVDLASEPSFTEQSKKNPVVYLDFRVP